eukprot:115437-Prorocentrum_lima.AAC.1
MKYRVVEVRCRHSADNVSGTTSYVPLVRLDICVCACGVTRGHVDAGAACGPGVKACGTVRASGCP